MKYSAIEIAEQIARDAMDRVSDQATLGTIRALEHLHMDMLIEVLMEQNHPFAQVAEPPAE